MYKHALLHKKDRRITMRIAVKYAVIPTGSRPTEYANVIEWCTNNSVIPITITTSAEARKYAIGITIDDDGLNISTWWNLGLDYAYSKGADIVLILNDDVVMPSNWLTPITKAIEEGASGASGERGNGVISGYAFALNAKDGIRADENLVWWYGDDDIQRQCEKTNGFVCVPKLPVKNLYAFISSRSRKQQIELDKTYYFNKWRLDVTVVVATHGTEEWRSMGDKAQLSAQATGAKVVRVHLDKGTVAEARNAGLAQVTTKYVVFLDADDDLEPDYFNDVRPAADVTVTSIKYPYSRQPTIPKVWQHEKKRDKLHAGPCVGACLVDGNWVHVGAICSTEAVRAVGGFREYPVYEDWALFLAMQQNGATFDTHPQSVYSASVRTHGNHRNSSMPIRLRNRVHEEIYNDIVKGSK